MRSTPRLPISASVPDVRLQPVHWRVVELPVARVHHASRGGLDDERCRVGDRVRDADELDAERAELEWLVARLGGDELGLLAEAVLVELRLHECERERCRENRVDIDLTQEVREPTHMILVPVREDDRAHASAPRGSRCPGEADRRRGARRAGTRARRRRR